MSSWFEKFQRKRPLSEKELLELIEIPLSSEDEMEGESDDDSDTDQGMKPDNPDSDTTEDEREDEKEDDKGDDEEDINKLQEASKSKVSMKKRNVLWKKGNLVLPDEDKKFLGSEELPQEILELDSPFQFFKYFFDDTLLEKISLESSLYSTQKNPNKAENITKENVQKFLGICLFTSVAYCTNVRDYWTEVTGSDFVKETMSLNQFEQLRSLLHFNNNENQIGTNDKLYKLRPLIDHLQGKFLSIPMEESLSVDEQICATKVRHHLKQYLPNKPHKWGYKLFFLCGVSGYAYKFEVYTGRENDPCLRPAEEPDLGACANIVIRLAREVPKFKRHKIFFDNFYTCLDLVVYLHKQGILTLGTIRRNRIPNCKLPLENLFKKEDRGTSVEFVTDFESVQVSCLAWKDNKVVHLMSSFCGQIPEHLVRRYDRKAKEQKQVNCPEIVKVYNKHMGGVDSLDSHIGRHRIRMKSKKWYFRLFFHLFDLATVNAWLLYKRVMQIKQKKPLNQKKFRVQIIQTLCRTGRAAPKRGRPSSALQEILELKKKRTPAAIVPPVEVRKDGLDHWPEWITNRGRCKYPSCKNLTYVFCTKCRVNLCLNQKNNCFYQFHTT